MLSVWLSALAGGFLYFALHLTASGSFPRPLTAAQERECLQKIKEGDQQARDYFIEHNLRLVAHIIKKYYASYKEQEDLISIGTIGLIKAVGTLDVYKRQTRCGLHCVPNAHKTLGTFPQGTVRFSVGVHNTEDQILFAIGAVSKVLKKATPDVYKRQVFWVLTLEILLGKWYTNTIGRKSGRTEDF